MNEAERILDECDAIIRGDHFVYITGQHGEGWIDKDAIFPHTDRIDRLGALVAEAVAGRELNIVCGPATGGLVVSQWTAHHLGLPSVFAEHGKAQGYDPKVREHGGEVVCVGALCTRGNADPGDVGCDDFVWLCEVQIPSWPAEECELCREGRPVNTRYAHGADFLAAKS